MNSVAFDVDGITKRYPRQKHAANRDISFTVGRSEIVGILGDNGAGKSTLIQQMAGLVTPDVGTVRLFGENVAVNRRNAARSIGYMPQSAFALQHMTVSEALYFSAHLRGLTRRAARRSREYLIERWHLGDSRRLVAKKLSGGQRRLLQLAVAMAGDPPVLVLDEPTNDLDPQRRRLVWDMLNEINRERGTTIVFITHDAVEAEKVVHRVGIICRGRLMALGPPGTLKAHLDDRIRVDVTFTEGPPPRLASGQEWEPIADRRWRVYLDRRLADGLMSDVRLFTYQDVRIQSVSLEDLYLHHADHI
jgi:ABC-type multidrug transport system ATPase subunit